MSTHTPGPWYFDPDPHKRQRYPRDTRVITGQDRIELVWVLDQNNYDRDAEVDATAQLVAAAPDLLAALHHYVGPQHAALCPAQFRDDALYCAEFCLQARAAIAKASGQAAPDA